uniref:Uncharacterized protein n=1 Tax=Chlamydomonas euryale TaxID=1486919 RepID=A0A7R9VZH6_9CHLO
MAARVANSGLHAGCTGVHGRPASACRMDRGTRPMKLERPAIPGQLRRHRVTASALTVRRPTMYSAATYAASAAAAAAAASGGAAAAAAAASQGSLPEPPAPPETDTVDASDSKRARRVLLLRADRSCFELLALVPSVAEDHLPDTYYQRLLLLAAGIAAREADEGMVREGAAPRGADGA